MDLFENYIKQASKYLVEDEEDFETDEIEEVEPDETEEEGTPEEGVEEEEVLELDLSNPVCPSCGAKLAPVADDVDTDELDDDEANAIELLKGLGYVVYKPEELADETDEEEGDIENDDVAWDDTEDDFIEDEE